LVAPVSASGLSIAKLSEFVLIALGLAPKPFPAQKDDLHAFDAKFGDGAPRLRIFSAFGLRGRSSAWYP